MFISMLLCLLFGVTSMVPAVSAESALASVSHRSRPRPVTIKSLCAECNGSRKIKTGDGLGMTECDCGSSCKCVPKTKSVLADPKKEAPKANCENGKCSIPQPETMKYKTRLFRR